MTTKTAICNHALTLLGQLPSLNNVDTDTSVNASRLRSVFDTVRDACLRAHAWNFATVRTTLAASSSYTPAWGHDAQYQLPPEYLGQLRFDPERHGSRKPDHRIVGDRTNGGRWIQASEGDTIYVEFVQRVEDTALFDPMFAEYLAARLAETVGAAISGKATVAEEMRALARDMARDARWADAIDTGRDTPDEGDFMSARAIP